MAMDNPPGVVLPGHWSTTTRARTSVKAETLTIQRLLKLGAKGIFQQRKLRWMFLKQHSLLGGRGWCQA